MRLRYKRERIVKAIVYVNGKRVQTTKGKRLKTVKIPPAGSGKHTVKIVLKSSRGKLLPQRAHLQRLQEDEAPAHAAVARGQSSLPRWRRSS